MGVDEHRAGGGQATLLVERLIGEEDSLLLADGEGAQAKAAGPIAVREIAMRGMAVLGCAERSPHFGGNRIRDALEAQGLHDLSVGRRCSAFYPLLAILFRIHSAASRITRSS